MARIAPSSHPRDVGLFMAGLLTGVSYVTEQNWGLDHRWCKLFKQRIDGVDQGRH